MSEKDKQVSQQPEPKKPTPLTEEKQLPPVDVSPPMPPVKPPKPVEDPPPAVKPPKR